MLVIATDVVDFQRFEPRFAKHYACRVSLSVRPIVLTFINSQHGEDLQVYIFSHGKQEGQLPLPTNLKAVLSFAVPTKVIKC